MIKIKIQNSEINDFLSATPNTFPKYTTQLMNLANQNAGGTRPRVVGQMSDLILEFPGNSIEEWEEWYTSLHPDSIEIATDRIYSMIELLKDAVVLIDKELVRQWVNDLVITKTYTGMKFQDAIVGKIAEYLGKDCRSSTPTEESQGIDGYIGRKPISIKPMTYKLMNVLREQIEVPIVFYEKKKDGINIEFEPADFEEDY